MNQRWREISVKRERERERKRESEREREREAGGGIRLAKREGYKSYLYGLQMKRDHKRAYINELMYM